MDNKQYDAQDCQHLFSILSILTENQLVPTIWTSI